MDEILSFAQRTALSGPIKPPTQLFCSREVSLPSINTSNTLASLGSAAETQSTSTSSTYADVVNISSGRGIIQFAAFGGDGGATQAEVTITIDGVTVVNAVNSGVGLRAAIGAISNVDGTNFRACIALGYVPYTKSFRYQLKRAAGGASASAFLKYYPI